MVLKGLVEILDAGGGTNMSKTVQHSLNENDLHNADLEKAQLHKPCHFTARLNFTEAHLDIENPFAKYYRVTKQKSSFLVTMMKTQSGAKIMKFSSQRTLC